ncbi:MAG: helix-turn-helix transcriptional regulator [Verrucomicrobiota bacterium]
MLIYFATGERRYGDTPLAPQRRRAWEFQIVLKGRIGVLLPGGPEPLQPHHLWIFPPEHSHGWVGEKTRAAQVAVFHFLSAPGQLNRLLNPKGFLEIALTPRSLHQIRELADKVEPYWNHPTPGMMICYEHALMALSLIAHEACAAHAGGARQSYPQSRVNAAILWYSERMEQNPAFPQVALAVGVSTAHLRRLFHEVLQASPNQIMDQLRFQRAMQLMSDPEIKLEEVGSRCGFGSASAFSRAFKTKFGASPQSWRPAELRRSRK